MANVGQVQVGRLASSLRTLDVGTAAFKNNLVDALLDLDRRSANPEVKAINILSGSIGTGVTISAGSITGSITSSSSVTIDASAITGLISAAQIGSVNTTSFVGSITAGQIASVNATSITGVVVSSQIADGIIDSLNRYSTSFRPLPTLSGAPSLPDDEYPLNSFYYNSSDGKFYQNQSGTWTEVTEGTATSGSLNYYFIGKVSVGSFVGLITAAQIDTVSATSITGSITASQIGSVNGGVIQSLTVTSSALADGTITGVKIAATTIEAGNIALATITDAQIASATITGAKIASATITNANISDLSVSKLSAGTAAFSGAAVFGYGTRKLTIDSLSIKIEQDTARYLSATGSSVRLYNTGTLVDVDAAAITISAVSGGSTTVNASGVTITSASGSAQAQLTGTTLTFTSNTSDATSGRTTISSTSVDVQKDTAHTVISAGGVQIYGGTTGIGIGASTYAASPVRISSSLFQVVFSSGAVELQASSSGISWSGTLSSATGSLSCEDYDTSSSGGTYSVNGQRVVGARGSAVADATGAGDVVAQLNALLAELRASTGHGLIAG